MISPFHNGLKDNISKILQKSKTRKRWTLFCSRRRGGTVELGGGGVVPFGEVGGAFYDGVHEVEKCIMLFVDCLHRRGALEAAQLYGT